MISVLTEVVAGGDDTVLLTDINKQKKILELNYRQPFNRKADVLFVYSNQTFYHIKNRYTPVTSYSLLDQKSVDAYQSGVLLDKVYIEDLTKLNLDKYKCIVFSNVFYLSSQQKLFIKEKVTKNGRHVIWNYMPGYTNGRENSITFIKDVTGFEVALSADTALLNIQSTSVEYPLAKNEKSSGHIYPVLHIIDKKAVPLGIRESTKEVVVAKKVLPDHTI